MTLELFEEPRADGAYVYGLDPAEGKGGGDPAALVVMDAGAEPPCQVALFRSRRAGFGDLAMLVRDLHENGYPVVRGSLLRGFERPGGLVPEVNVQEMQTALGNGMGGVAGFEPEYFYQQRGAPTIQEPQGALRRLGYRNMGGKEGTKTFLLDTLREALEAGALRQADRFLGLEALYWDRLSGRWTFQAPSVGLEELGHGDVTIATALAFMGCLAVREWIGRHRLAAMGPHQAPQVYYDWSKWKVAV